MPASLSLVMLPVVPRPPGRPPKERDAALVRRLETFAADYERRIAKLDAQREELRARRDDQIKQASVAGLPEVDIAAIFGLSQQYVNRLVRRWV